MRTVPTVLACRLCQAILDRASFAPWLLQDPLIRVFESPDNALTMCQHLSGALLLGISRPRRMFYEESPHNHSPKVVTHGTRRRLRELHTNMHTHMLSLAPRLLPEVILATSQSCVGTRREGRIHHPSPVATHYGEPLRTSEYKLHHPPLEIHEITNNHPRHSCNLICQMTHPRVFSIASSNSKTVGFRSPPANTSTCVQFTHYSFAKRYNRSVSLTGLL